MPLPRLKCLRWRRIEQEWPTCLLACMTTFNITQTVLETTSSTLNLLLLSQFSNETFVLKETKWSKQTLRCSVTISTTLPLESTFVGDEWYRTSMFKVHFHMLIAQHYWKSLFIEQSAFSITGVELSEVDLQIYETQPRGEFALWILLVHTFWRRTAPCLRPSALVFSWGEKLVLRQASLIPQWTAEAPSASRTALQMRGNPL